MHRVDKQDCIIWKHAIDGRGYGAKWHKGKVAKAHRLAFCEAQGIELEDIAHLVIRHKCDVRACVNPEHLESGTPADNVRDMVERGRASYAKGCKAPMDTDKAREVWTMRAKGYTQRQIAETLETTQQNVSLILQGKAWKGSKPSGLQL